MSTNISVGAHPGQQASTQSIPKWWRLICALLLVAILIEAIFAGAMLSGAEWALAAHRATAAILILSALAAGTVALITLRRVPHGLRLGLTLMALAAALIVQATAGAMSAKGANLLWVHVPLGVALFGVARLAVDSARRMPPHESAQ